MNWAFIAVMGVGVWALLIAFAMALLKAGAEEDAERLRLHGLDCSCVAHRDGLAEWAAWEAKNFPE